MTTITINYIYIPKTIDENESDSLKKFFEEQVKQFNHIIDEHKRNRNITKDTYQTVHDELNKFNTQSKNIFDRITKQINIYRQMISNTDKNKIDIIKYLSNKIHELLDELNKKITLTMDSLKNKLNENKECNELKEFINKLFELSYIRFKDYFKCLEPEELAKQIDNTSGEILDNGYEHIFRDWDSIQNTFNLVVNVLKLFLNAFVSAIKIIIDVLGELLITLTGGIVGSLYSYYLYGSDTKKNITGFAIGAIVAFATNKGITWVIKNFYCNNEKNDL